MAKVLNRVLGGSGGGGGTSANIYVTGLQQTDTVSMLTPSGKTVSGEWGEIVSRFHDIPVAYQLLDYIENCGNGADSRIETDILPSSSMSIKAKFQFLSPNNVDNTRIFPIGVRYWDGTEKINYRIIHYQSSRLMGDMGNGSVNNSNRIEGNISLSLATDYYWEYGNHYIKNLDTGTNYLSGNAVSSFTYPSQYPLVALYTENNNYVRNRLYDGAEIYENGVIVARLRTCYRVADNKTGIYNDVTGVFYEGAGNIIRGNEIPKYVEGYTFHANELGMHTITATNGAKTSTEEVLVDSLMDYYVEIILGRLYLYKYGDERESITGGWELFPRANWGYTLPTKGVDSLIFNGKQSIRTKNNIDVQNYSKLYFHLVSGRTSNYLSFALNNGFDFSVSTTWWSSPIYNTSVNDRSVELFSIADAGASALRNTPSRVAMFFDGATNVIVDAVWLE